LESLLGQILCHARTPGGVSSDERFYQESKWTTRKTPCQGQSKELAWKRAFPAVGCVGAASDCAAERTQAGPVCFASALVFHGDPPARDDKTGRNQRGGELFIAPCLARHPAGVLVSFPGEASI
jgi:hypothetical protein